MSYGTAVIVIEHYKSLQSFITKYRNFFIM